MDGIHKKIQKNALVVGMGLLVVAAFMVLAAFASAWSLLAGGAPLDFSEGRVLDTLVRTMTYALLTALIMYAARIFFRISTQETPFFKELPRKIKTAAVMLFFALAIPRWIGYALHSFAIGSIAGAVVDEVLLAALVMSGLLFCLGQVFEYGYLLQDESYDIL